MVSWLTFIKERFSPLSHGAMLALFIFIHLRVGENIQDITLPLWQFATMSTAVVLFFFNLRLYDEIKDYDLDCIKNPSRPLPRGLITIPQMKKAIIITLILTAGLFLLSGLHGAIGAMIAMAYGILMYNEFFIPKVIRPHLTTYAVSHTFVTYILGLGILGILLQKFFWELPLELHLFSLANWALFNLFEFGRKTYAREEEREGVDTYSSLFKPFGAVALLLSQVIVVDLLLIKTGVFNPSLYPLILHLGAGVMILGLLYIIINTKYYANLYRGLSSGYIIVFYLLLAAHFVR